jgi:hypothetical protein
MKKVWRQFVFWGALLLAHVAAAQPAVVGAWQAGEGGPRLDILDGFKPGTGPLLWVDEKGKVSASSWRLKGESLTLKLGYRDYEAILDAKGRLVLTPKYGRNIVFSALEPQAEDAVWVNLKKSPAAFIDALTGQRWLTSYDGGQAQFASTFGSDSGVMQLVRGERFDLRAWGLSSGVLKVGQDVLLEGRISKRYFIGLDKNSKFVIFRAIGPAAAGTKTALRDQREAFFNAMLTGEWETQSFGRSETHRFRPVFGELSGVQFTTRGSALTNDSTWEFSPNTGSLKLGGRVYVGAMVVNDTLALVDKKGDQRFFRRAAESSSHRFTLGDVNAVALNENELPKIAKLLSPQLQRGQELYQFEFKASLRDGYVHRFRSEPFDITGGTFKNPLIGTSKKVYQVEDFIVFDNDRSFKMDATPSRLRPKTDAEARVDVQKQAALKQDLQARRLMLRVMKKDGTSVDISLPIAEFADIASMSVVAE